MAEEFWVADNLVHLLADSLVQLQMDWNSFEGMDLDVYKGN